MAAADLSLVPHATPLADMLAGLTHDGFDTLVLWPVEPSARDVELFAVEVVPRLSDVTH